jgi:hypothetical protein
MRSKLFALLSLVAAPALFGAVSETPEEFHGTGDLNGDGRVDVIIVDKVSGAYRLGYGQADGTNIWADSRASGVENVTGFGVGRALNTSRDALAFTSPEANRVNLFDASAFATAGQPTNVFLSSLGPSRVVLLDIAAAGNTAHDDFYVPSIENNPAAPYRLTLQRSTGSTFPQINDLALTAEVVAADRIKLKTNGANVLVGALSHTSPNYTFTAQALTSSVPTTITFTANLPQVDAFLFGNFNNTAFNQFLFYKGGTSNLILRPTFEPVLGFVQFGAGTTFSFADALRQVIAVPGPNDVRLLIIFGEGETAGVYSFDGTNAPVLVESFVAEEGETFAGASALGGGNLSLYSGENGRSTKFQTWNRSGNGYVKGASGNLPALNPLSTAANVFLFANQPFVHPTPMLLGSLNAADWSSGLNLSNPANARVNAERFRGEAEGLGDPMLKNLGPVPAGAGFGLPNQIAESFSLLSFSPAVGSEVVEVTISPKPGKYSAGVSVTFNVPSQTNALVFYRLGNSDTWKIYVNTPISLFKETTVSYYALAGGKKTTIKSATYTFESAPSDLDSDGDGVPDFVELGLGGDDAALHSKDSDGDGYSDLAEILAGTNGAPYNPNIAPTNQARADELSGFDWFVFPQSLAGYVPGLASAQTGTVLYAYDLHGGLLGNAPTVPFFGGTVSWFSNLFADVGQRLYIAATEPHFDIQTNGFAIGTNDTRIGRELLRLLPAPEGASGLVVNYTYGGGTLAQETSNWVAAAKAAQSAVSNFNIVSDFTYDDTLVALLCERKIGELLVARDLLASSNRITLFPFRAQDAGRINPAHSNLLSLETNKVSAGGIPDPMFPGHKLAGIYQSLSQAVTSPPTGQAQKLRDLATDVYRISALSNNAAPGKYPSPVDTIRGFLETGVLNSNYLAATTLGAADLAAAQTGATQVLAGVTTRPTTNVILRVTASSFAVNGCVVLETMTGFKRALVLPDGSDFKFPEAFQLAADSTVEVYGYTDRPASCGAQTIEIISLSLTAIPAPGAGDADGDLLSDAWECLYLTFDPNADSDGDGAKNLQEFLDGTDPLNALSAGAPVDLGPPQVNIVPDSGNLLKLSWSFPEPYASKMKFQLLATDALGQPFVVQPDVPQGNDGQFQIVLPNSAPIKFYRLQLSLK